jgi:hypothetical protein
VVAFVVLLHLFNGENPSLGHVLANIQCKITKNGSVKENHISRFCDCDSCILRFSMMCHRVDISCWHVLRTFRGIDLPIVTLGLQFELLCMLLLCCFDIWTGE